MDFENAGFTGGGLQGVGFGMAIDAEDNVWATCYGTRTIVKFDNSGKPLSPPDGYNFNGQLGLMQGIIIAPNGDVWVLDVEKSQVVHFPKGDPSSRWQRGAWLAGIGSGLAGPWAAVVDGNDHVWISNFANPTVGIVELAGCRPETNPPGLEMGDPISPPDGYVGGGLQSQIDLAIDPAGNVWVGNNWDNFDAVLGRVPEPLSTRGAGQGLVVFYGMAKPVHTPLIGPAGF